MHDCFCYGVQINGTSVGWALGYMLNATSEIPDVPTYVTNDYNLSADWFITGVVVLGIAFIITIIFTFVILYCGCRRQGYVPVQP